MRIKLGKLKQLLREASAIPQGAQGEDSIDRQIDHYLSEYEASSKHSKNEGRLDFISVARRLMREADDDADDKKAAAPSAPVNNKLSADDIDVAEFANNVDRLIENVSSLLEFQGTITRRAFNYLAKTYDDSVTEEFSRIMRSQYGIEPGETKDEVEAEDYQAPRAKNAGPSGGS